MRHEDEYIDTNYDGVSSDPFDGVPSYIIGANNHDVAAGNSSLLDTAMAVGSVGSGIAIGASIGSTVPVIGTVIGGVVGGITGALIAPSTSKFAQATLLDTANTFYNSGVAIANIALVDDIAYSNAYDFMDSYDSDLSAYYVENRDSIDTASFIGGSFIPGLGALGVYNKTTKALNAAKLGAAGKNYSAASGLLVPKQQKFLRLAQQELTTTTSAISYRNQNLIKSVSLGIGEQAIQAAIFETAAVIALNQAPMLEGQDFSDIAENVLWGTVVGAGIGGVFEVATTFGKLRKGLDIAEAELRKYQVVEGLKGKAASHEKIINFYENKFSTGAVDPKLDAKYGDKATKLNSKKTSFVEDSASIELQKLTQGGSAVDANYISAVLKSANSTQEVAHTVLGLHEISRVADASASLKPAAKLKAKINKRDVIKEGATPKADLKALDDLEGLSEVTFKVFGEGAGNIIKGATHVPIQDTLKAGKTLKVTSKGVTDGNKTHKFALTASKKWSVVESSLHEAQARTLWSMAINRLPDNFTLNEFDLPLISRAYKDSASTEGLLKYRLRSSDGKLTNITRREDLLELLRLQGDKAKDLLHARSVTSKTVVDKATKDKRLIDKLGIDAKSITKGELEVMNMKASMLTTEDIAAMLNRKLGNLEETNVNTANLESDLFAAESAVAEYTEKYKGINSGVKPEEILLHPQHLRLVYDTKLRNAITQHELDGMVYIRQQQKIYEQEVDIATAPVFGEAVNQLQKIPEKIMRKARSSGAGSGVVAPADGDLGSLASFMQRIGQVVNKIKGDKINLVKERLEPLLFKLGDSVESSVEYSAIQNIIRNTPEKYVLDDEGTGLILRGLKRYRDAVAKGEEGAVPYAKIDPDAADTIPLESSIVRDILSEHIAINGERISQRLPILATKREMSNIDPDTLYFPPPDEKSFKFKAFVVDDTITGTGHTKMIYAASEAELGELIAKVPSNSGLSVITKRSSERWHRAIGDLKLDEAITENYIDSALQKSGVSAKYFPDTDAEKMVNELMEWHINKEVSLVREAVGAKYYKEFEELRVLGEGHTELATSKAGYGSLSRRAAEDIDNPYMSYIRTALDIPNTAKIPLRSFQNWADVRVSEIWNTMTNATSKTVGVEDLDTINDMWQRAGIKTAYYDGALASLVNHTADRGALSTFVRRGNAILASITLRPDVLNAANNTIGSAVLSVPQTKWLIGKIKAGDTDAIGDLAKLGEILVPGTTDSILSTTKLFSNALKNFTDQGSKAKKARYLANGWTTRGITEIQTIHDTLKLSEVFSTADLNGKITSAYNRVMKLFDKAEILSGNKLAEEFTRFMSADIMDQLTSIAVKHKIIGQGEADAYINTFVNKLNGNYLASQRPMMFHGPVGQAVGLFQTYQVNFLQQMLGNIKRGESRAAGMIMGMQGTIYGMNGLPAFQALNTHLIGSMSGNTDNKDIYSSLYQAVDKRAADWFMYGAGSNALGLLHPDLKINLYSRGDINPRQLTIVPTTIEQLPITGAATKFFANLKTMYSRAAAGGSVWDVMLQGLEHNGLSRPLSGIGQILEASTNAQSRSFSTTKAGALIASNELLSIVNVARVLGAKPLDEAITTDASFRNVVYAAKKSDATRRVGAALRTKVIGNKVISGEDLFEFQKDYMAAGGKQDGFNRFFTSIQASANTARANIIIRNLKDPKAQRMQDMLDGGELMDFTNSGG